jgi:hypothetical protein
MKSKKTALTLAIGGALISAGAALADPPKVEFPQASPACTLKQRVGLTDIEIDYSRPSVKGRKIFGELVPYGKVWRTGANQATKVIFSTPVKLNGTEVPAGTYALMTIPGPDEWTVIINKMAEQWGAYKYDEKADVARIKTKPVQIDRSVETMAINIDDIRDNTSDFVIIWDKTKVPVKLEVEYKDKLTSEIDKVMSSDAKQKPYYQAAQFYFANGLDLHKAKDWVDSALAEKDLFYVAYLKAQILKKLGDKPGALAAAKHSSELSQKANEDGFVALNAELIKSLQ